MNPDVARSSFDAIYEAESDAIFRFSIMRVSDRDVALDITQETFTRLWQSLLKGQELTNARAFLFVVAKRLIIDWYRRNKPLALSSLDNSDTDEAFDIMDPTAYDKIVRGGEGRILLRSIDQISGANRLAVRLRFVDDLTPQEIGEVLGISANAASVRITRGLDELRRISGIHIQERK